jgi:hypothetical protein
VKAIVGRLEREIQALCRGDRDDVPRDLRRGFGGDTVAMRDSDFVAVCVQRDRRAAAVDDAQFYFFVRFNDDE